MEQLPVELLTEVCHTATDARLQELRREVENLRPRCEYVAETCSIELYVGGCHMSIEHLGFSPWQRNEQNENDFQEMIRKIKQGEPHVMKNIEGAVEIETDGKEVIFSIGSDISGELYIRVPNEAVVGAFEQLLAS